MSRAKRSMKRRQFRFSLDPMDPVEGEALRQIDEIADQAKEMFESISQDEADRYAFKRILLGLLKDRPVELTAPARSAPVAVAPALTSAPAAVVSTPAAPQPEAVRTPVEQLPKAQEVPVEKVVKEGDQEEGGGGGSQSSSAATETSASSPEPSWHEQLLSSEAAKPASPLNNLVWAGNRPSE
ncbi:hypothetical protein U2H31_003652 [Pseudomonas aeruginosa]|nr:hypothetical protein [Pseudomonas aeruginosa]